MTCIIGVVCKDGIVLIGDRKIKAGERATYQNKIIPVKKYDNLVVAAAGIVEVREKFIQDIYNLPALLEEEVLKKDSSRGFVGLAEDIAFRLWEIYKPRYEAEYIDYEDEAFSAFVCQKPKGSRPTLYCVNSVGTSSRVDDYMVLGTGGQYADIIMKPCYDRLAFMNRIAAIGSFVILLVDYYKIDESIGVETDGSTQIWKFPNKSNPYEVKGAELEGIMKEARELLQRYGAFLVLGEMPTKFVRALKRAHSVP